MLGAVIQLSLALYLATILENFKTKFGFWSNVLPLLN